MTNPLDAILILISLFIECVRRPGGVASPKGLDEKNENDKITIFLHFYVYLVVS